MKRERNFHFISKISGRADKIISSECNIPRSVFENPYTLFINNKREKKGSKVNVDDEIDLTYIEEIFDKVTPEDISLNIIYEDDDILLINKDQGMVVHVANGNYTGTLSNALLFKYGDGFDDGSLRPGIVHRLDKETSGVMIIAKNAYSHEILSKEFQNREVEKYYIAICKGLLESPSGIIEKRICRDRNNRKKFTVTDRLTHSKDAKTSYKVLSQNNGYSFLLLRLYTGRTHQIRVHLQSINHPVLGDSIYSRKDDNFPDESLMLNSYSLSFIHPRSGERMKFVTPIPDRFISFLEKVGIEIPPNFSEIKL